LAGNDVGMGDPVRAYVEAIPPEHRPLFDRVHALIMQAHPDASVGISYKIPTYRVGSSRLYVGVWTHGLSLYGWKQGGEGGFAARHPELVTSKGTIRLRPTDAEALGDDELLDLVRAALAG
jgi:uncharacterized protein YdhG (YjbR/CyaY superfamily)